MSITGSVYTLDAQAQIDGRRYCTESHTDSGGVIYRMEYLAEVGADCVALLAAHAASIAARIKIEDMRAAVFDGTWDYALTNATNAELADFVREQYRNANRERLAAIAKRILEWIANGRFTDLQVRNAFGLTAGQWTTLKTKMTTLAANYDAIQVAAGE